MKAGEEEGARDAPVMREEKERAKGEEALGESKGRARKRTRSKGNIASGLDAN